MTADPAPVSARDSTNVAAAQQVESVIADWLWDIGADGGECSTTPRDTAPPAEPA